jgi:hypothetical protein
MSLGNDTLDSKGQVLDNQHSSGKCPYLGLITDPDTALDYPSIWNSCHHSKPPAVPVLEHQKNACLTSNYVQCPVYNSEVGSSFPLSLSEPDTGKSRIRWSPFIIGGIVLLMILGIFLLSRRYLQEKSSGGTIDSTPNQELTLNQPTMEEPGQASITTPEMLATSTGLMTSTEILTPRMTSTANEEIPHRLDVPIGKEQKLIIHQVLEGESLEQYAVLYNTNRDTIVKLNYFLPVPLWINWLIVIPLDLAEQGDLPTFEAYLVTEEKITVEKLAEKLAIDPVDFAFYNGIEENHILKSGEWFLVPRQGYLLYNQ